MSIMQILAIAAAAICLCSLFVFFLKIVKLGKPNDLSEKSGDTTKGVVYSNTTAMMPQNKESAYLHLPAYASGILFHLGIFLCLLVFVLSFFPFFNRWISGPDKIHYIIPCLLAVSTICGYALLLRRAFSTELKPLSNPDDFISNGLVSTFQLMTLLYMLMPTSTVVVTLYYIVAILLFLYMPLGKLRHAVFYFAARFHLGYFYGWRNVWPKNEK
ncbi:MAG: hypothetical protein K6F40_07245 [Bacteroidales bacterium]|nr:hypothetical protein [Bacteroidales bacterium]